MRLIIFLQFLLFSLLCGQNFEELARIGGEGREPGKFNKPLAVSVSKDGTVYVVDTGNNRIQLFDLKGELIKTVGGFGFQNDQFDTPMDIWTRSLINIYVADYNNQRLQRYDRNMNFISTFTNNRSYSNEFQFFEISSIAVSSQNDLLVLDRGDNKIIKFNRDSRPERSFGSYESGKGELRQPEQLDILPDNRLIVTDTGRRSIIQFDNFGNFLGEIKHKEFKIPRGLAVSDKGRIFLADPGAGKVFVISDDFKSITEIKNISGLPLKHPQDVAVWRGSGVDVKSQTLYIIDENELVIGTLTD